MRGQMGGSRPEQPRPAYLLAQDRHSDRGEVCRVQASNAACAVAVLTRDFPQFLAIASAWYSNLAIQYFTTL